MPNLSSILVWQENYTALHLAVEAGKHSVVETLLGQGAQVHIQGTSFLSVKIKMFEASYQLFKMIDYGISNYFYIHMIMI